MHVAATSINNPADSSQRFCVLCGFPQAVRQWVGRTCVCLLATAVLCRAQTPRQPNAVAPGEQEAIIQFLNQTVGWYQHRSVERQSGLSDLLFTSNAQPMADQVVRLAFDFARARSQVLTPVSSESTDPRYRNLEQSAAKLDARFKETTAKLESLRRQLPRASARSRGSIVSAIAETESEVALLQVRQKSVHDILQFMGGAAGPRGLASEIDALQRSVPAASPGGANSAGLPGVPTTVAAPASSGNPAPSGIWEILREFFSLSRRLEVVEDGIRATDDLAKNAKGIQTPLRKRLGDLISQGDTLANQPDSSSADQLRSQKAALDETTSAIKYTTSALLPLGEMTVLLDLYRKNLVNWRDSLKSEYSANLKSLALRLVGLVFVLVFVVAAFELWRRAIFHYVGDVRRRYQFLLLRRIVLWLVIVLIVTLGMVSELGSLATFAGLMTAGVAVALQNVILAVVGYFFLIGKFGVRVGDRVQTSGVTGQVVEIGLTRLHIMELIGTGADAQPTGRVVAFSNSIVFQPNAGLFRQIPGANFVWHEITLTLSSEADYREVEQRMLAAVQAALRDYHQDLEQLRLQMEVTLSSISVGSIAPRVQLRLTPAGIEVHLSFPVEFRNAAEIDDRVMREILAAIEQAPKLKLLGAEVPAVRIRAGTH